MPTPMKKMPGMNFHDASRATMAYTPHAIHTSARSPRNAGFEGRLPGWTGLSGTSGRRFDAAFEGRALVPRGVVRPPFLRALATRGTLVV